MPNAYTERHEWQISILHSSETVTCRWMGIKSSDSTSFRSLQMNCIRQRALNYACSQ